MIKSKTYTNCLSHECDVCGRKLKSKMFWQEIVLLVVIVSVLYGSVFFISYLENRWITNCYTREYISGRGTDMEVLENTDIECPEI